MEFVMNNIMWFIFAGIILLMTMIGYYAEKTDFGRNVDDDNKKSKKEKKSKDNKKEEPAGIPVLENIEVEKNTGNNSVIENTNPLDEEVTNIENNNLDNVSLETVNEENNNTDTVTNDNQEVTKLENSQKEDIISEPLIEEVVTDIVEEKKEEVVSEPVTEDVVTEVVEEKQEEVVSEPKIEEVTTETVEEKIEDNVSKTVVEDGKDNQTNEVQEELPSMDELMDQSTEDKKAEENIESVKNEEIPSESVNSEEIKENNIEENVVEEIEELPTEVVEEIQEEVSTESKVDDSHPVEEEVGISEIDAENLPVKIEEPVTVSKNNNSDIPEVSIDEIKEQKDVTVEKPQKKSWFGKKKSKKVDTPVDIGIREADSNEVLENTKEPNNDSNDEDDIWKF